MKDLKSMCDTYKSFEELIEEKDDPRHLLDTLESKSIKSIVVPLEYYFYPLESIYVINFFNI